VSKKKQKLNEKKFESLKSKPRKVRGRCGLMRISGQNILEVNEGKSPLEMHGNRGKNATA